MNHLKLIAFQDFPLIEPGDDLSQIILNSINNNNINTKKIKSPPP